MFVNILNANKYRMFFVLKENKTGKRMSTKFAQQTIPYVPCRRIALNVRLICHK